MQLKDANPQQKLQEMCDCYMETDFAAQLAAMSRARSEDPREDAVKYLALAIMYGVTEKARKATFEKKGDEIRVRLKTADEKIELPPPDADLFEAVRGLIFDILHLEKEGGDSPLALGLRTNPLELQVKVKEKKDKTSLKIKFPELGD
ncbi:MAG: hypothetical protein RBR09_12420 [Desulfobulbaceae bacterium]|jgi:hypothetical protein|nr:hypothetical protein [Desulfobulbaceae bacterium]MDY0352054.1 hypothetical protein [Desulfobulbaceae bacterium]